MSMNATRRHLLATIPAAAVAASAQAMAFNTSPAPADRQVWEAALDAHHRLVAEDQAFSATYWKQLDACRAECDRVPNAMPANERAAATRAIRERYGMNEADEQSDAFGERLGGSEDAVMNTPAPDLAALRWEA
jgi:Spy/CpxP family protein refolding chaperone